MSRIHEALKKAEQERTANQGGGSEADLMAVAIPNPPQGGEDSTVAVATLPTAGPTVAGVASFASPYSLETLLARCPPVEWKPDPATMLFFNGDDSTRGTEEFRTLRSRLY